MLIDYAIDDSGGKFTGKMSFMWVGPVPRVIIMDPELIKEVLNNKFGHFAKPKQTPFTKLLAKGLANIDGEKWATHRRILTPAFHQEKLKVIYLILITQKKKSASFLLCW